MNKNGRKVIAVLLTMMLCASSFLMVLADDDPDYFSSDEYPFIDYDNECGDEEAEDYGLYDDCQEEEAIAECTDYDSNNDGNYDSIVGVNDEEQHEYSLKISKNRLSFGTLVHGTSIADKEIYIANTGKTPVKLIWKETDPDRAFSLSMPEDESINPGEKKSIYVGVNDDIGAGEYSAVLLFADESDSAYDAGVQLQLSVTIENAKTGVERVIIIPKESQASPGSELDFDAYVEGFGAYDNAVDYSLAGAKSTSTVIDENGHLKIGDNENARTFKVTATAKDDSKKSDTAIVSIKENMHTVNVKSEPGFGGMVSGAGNYKDGENVTLSAYPNSGWKFAGWEIDGQEIYDSATYRIGSIASDVSATAYFEQEYVKIKAEPNHKRMGEVKGAGKVAVGDTVTLTAKAKDGYSFKCWMEGKKKVSADTKLKLKDVDESREFTAVFVKNKCNVKLTVNDERMGEVSGGKSVETGDSLTIKAKPKKGYKFVGWLWNDKYVTDSAEYKINNVTDDMCLVAYFATEEKTAKICNLTVGTADSNGVISPNGKLIVHEGESVNFTVTPKSGYRIAAIAIDGKRVDIESAFTFSNIKGDHTIVAAFLPIRTNNTAKTNEGKPAIENNKEASDNTSGSSELYEATNKRGSEEYDEHIVDIGDTPKEDEADDDSDAMGNEMDLAAGLLQDLDISKEDAKALIDKGEAKLLIEKAIENEHLIINYSNDMNDDDSIDISETLTGVFDDDELLGIVSGERLCAINVCVSNSNEKYITDEQKQLINSNLPDGSSVGTYFCASFIKMIDGKAQVVSEFSSPLKISLDVPEDLKKAGRSYKILRLHESDGKEEVALLDNISESSDKIEFVTDKFSTYAIAYVDSAALNGNVEISKNTPANESDKALHQSDNAFILIAVCAAVILVLLIAIVIIIRQSGRKKKHRR